jgi:hypothetical protein
MAAMGGFQLPRSKLSSNQAREMSRNGTNQTSHLSERYSGDILATGIRFDHDPDTDLPVAAPADPLSMMMYCIRTTRRRKHTDCTILCVRKAIHSYFHECEGTANAQQLYDDDTMTK